MLVEKEEEPDRAAYGLFQGHCALLRDDLGYVAEEGSVRGRGTLQKRRVRGAGGQSGVPGTF